MTEIVQTLKFKVQGFGENMLNLEIWPEGHNIRWREFRWPNQPNWLLLINSPAWRARALQWKDIKTKSETTRPSVNFAKDWLDQLFHIFGLGKGTSYGCDHSRAVNNHFSVHLAIFGTVTTKRTTKQLGDPSASLLLTSEKAVFCTKTKRML